MGINIPELQSLTDPEGDHALLKRARDEAPFVRTPMGTYLALRYRHADLLMNNDNTRQFELETMHLQGIASGPIYDFFSTGMLMANGEAHQRRRRPIAKAFAFKLMETMRGTVAAMAREILAERSGRRTIDFLNEVAALIPARVMAKVLGIPPQDLQEFSRWTDDAARAIGIFPPDMRAQIEASMTAFDAKVAALLEERKRRPQNDFLTAYVEAVERSGDLSELEIRTQIVGLILAGSETTRTALCGILSLLLQNPEQWRAFCSDTGGLKRAVVDEGLRFDPVISGVARLALKELDIEGYRFPAGSLLVASFLSALRDPDVYASPDAFNIWRMDHPKWHLVFGAGAHRCLGEALARVELEAVLCEIAQIAPDIELVGDPPRIQGLSAIRRIDRMEVRLN